MRITGKEAQAWAEVMRRVCEQRGWIWRDPYTLHHAINVFGIRSMSSVSGVYDDEVLLVVGHPSDGVVVWRWCITTDPGPYFMEHPIHPRGCGSLAHGHQYQYRLGWHRVGKKPGYRACNQAGKVLMYRDNNRDRVFEYDVNTIMVGRFGVNHHHGGEDSEPGDTFEGKSAACQVWCRKTEFNDEYLPLVALSEKHHGAGFPYALLLQAEVEAAWEAYQVELRLQAAEAEALQTFTWPFFD